MRKLTATLCLTLAVLVGSTTEGFALPPCPGSYDKNTWSNCFGTWTFGNGDKYVGEYQNNQFNGQGTIILANGGKYVGEWKDDRSNGQGTFTYADGRVEEGIWENGILVRESARSKKKRIAKENKRKKERIAKENKRKKERIAKKNQRKKERIEREKRIASNPGFRDLKPGLHSFTIKKKKVCKGSLNKKSGTTCYGLGNLKFRGKFGKGSFLEKLTVELGPIVGSVGFINELSTYLQKGETNIYLNMRKNLKAKYKIDFEFSERDRQLFNENIKDKLYVVYSKGQVALLINRKKRGYSKDVWLYVEYRDVILHKIS